MSVISESITYLNKSFTPIMGYLKLLTEYQREVYKLDVRDVTLVMPESDAANLAQVRKKFAQVKHGVPFYPDLVEEVLKEDYSKEGPVLRENVLKKLIVAEDKPKTVKAQVSFKSILIEGIQALGGTAVTLQEIAGKLNENESVIENRKQGIIQKIKKIMQQVLNKEPDPIIYNVEYTDPVKGIPVKEKVNFNTLLGDLDRKIRTLSPMAARGSSAGKLETMQEEQLVNFLDRNIREVQSIHKILSAMDDFFKAEVDKEDRDKIKGIKPELGTIKNAIIKANSKRHEYAGQKEEEEQLKRLGVKPENE
jgi:hypothetical protein